MAPLSPLDAVESFGSTVLTRREHDIVRLIFLGYPNIKIAERLHLSVNTVKNHRKRMYLKLDITTERELILKFMLPYVSQP
ncbi:helix-turn-helix transcriptional regulator [Aminobacter anthyllidis]|uniref:Helix-turn-helix transcriptional regulator n=2 Tax=Aminobacter anthyllidis TaxID=1035067 RepID=A0A9X1AH55_9HYPH|nr:helix-turn-helix transcriptional regulator [Aminobacter anthyllidis]